MSHSIRYLSTDPELDTTITVPTDKTILQAGLEADFTPAMNYSCLAGNCIVCVAHLESGTVENANPNNFLDSGQIAAGYFLPCMATASSDVVCTINQESQLNQLRG